MSGHMERVRAFQHWSRNSPDKSYASPELLDALAILEDYDELLAAAQNVAFRGPKCDCEMCEDAFKALQDLLP